MNQLLKLNMQSLYLLSVLCIILFAFSNCKKRRIEIPIDISFFAHVDTSNIQLTLSFDNKNEGEVPLGILGCEDSVALVIRTGEGDHSYKVTNGNNKVLFEGLIHIKQKQDPKNIGVPTKGDQHFSYSLRNRKISCIAVLLIVDPFD